MTDQKELLFDLDELNKLYEDDNLIDIERDVDVGKHIPYDVIGKGLEFRNIALTENIELNRIWAELKLIMRNLYIQSASEQGIDAYIKLIDKKIKGNLEEKRKMVFFYWNKLNVYTDRTLRELLNNLLGEDAYEIEFIYNDYEIVFEIFISKTDFNLAELFILLREIVPANEVIKFIVTMKEEIRIEETFEEYKIHHYKVGDNLYRCGTIYEQSPAMVVTENVEISGTSEVAYNRPVKTGETSAGNRADRS